MKHWSLKIFGIVYLLSTAFANGQVMGSKVVDPKQDKVQFKKVNLYDGPVKEQYNIRGFSQLVLFDENLVDYWSAENKSCLSYKIIPDNSEVSILQVQWNADQSECDWVGMGFGWDGWKGKDMGYVRDTLALELVVRASEGTVSNIPWAFAFEDYAGSQAWLGYKSAFLQSETITTEWSRVVVPVELFPFDQYGVNVTNIKQLIIQVFASGVLEIASIKLVPFSGRLRNEVAALSTDIQIDGDLSEWEESSFQEFEDNKFAVSYQSDSLYFAFQVVDETPMVNEHQKEDLWKGDAVEIALSTNPEADPQRQFMLMSDFHFGLNCGEQPYIWDWQSSATVTKDINYSVVQTEEGYSVELAVPRSFLNYIELNSGLSLDIEVAINFGDGDSRKVQYRWNSQNQDGFYSNPSLWGVLLLK
jgi:hypothetical protein